MEDNKVTFNGTDTLEIGIDKVLQGIPKTGNVVASTTEDETKTEDEKAKAALEELEKDELANKENKDGKTDDTAKTGGEETKEIKTDDRTDDVDEDDIIAEFKAEFGEVEGEFDQSTEGLKDYFKKVAPKLEEAGKAKGVEELFTKLPVVGQFAEHIANGYGVESFMKQVEAIDYSKISTETEDMQEKLYRAALQARGNDKEDIDSMVEVAKDSGKLKNKSELSKTYLSTAQQAEIEAQKKIEKEQTDENERVNKENLAKVDAVLKSGNLAGVKLDDAQIKRLRKFGTEVGADGLTERDKKWGNLTIEQMLLLDHIVDNDFKPLGVKASPASTEAKRLTDLKKKSADVKQVDLRSGKTDSGSFKTNPKILFGN